MKKELSIMDKDLVDQYVVLKDKYYKGDEIDRVFLCKGGFGCHPFTSGSAVFGEFISYGPPDTRIERYEIERFATTTEITAAMQRLNERIVQKQKELEEKRKKTRTIRLTFLDKTTMDLGPWDPLNKINLSISEFINDGIRCNDIDEANISSIDFVF